jgi:hypothetical protein
MKRLLIIAVCLVLAGVILLDLAGVSLCDGSFPLEVTVTTRGDEAISAVAYSWEESDAVRQLSRESSQDTIIRPFAGKPISVDVPCTYRVSVVFERNVGYAQYRLLTVAVQYQGGRFEYKTVNIPDGRLERTLLVSFP